MARSAYEVVGKLFRQSSQLLDMVYDGQRDGGEVQQLLQAGIEGKAAGLFAPRYNLSPFTPVDAQWQLVRDWNEQEQWGFPLEVVQKLRPHMAWLQWQTPHPLQAWVLVVYLDDPADTVHAWCKLIDGQTDWFIVMDQTRYILDPKSVPVELSPGVEWPGRTIRWELIDFSTHWNPEYGDWHPAQQHEWDLENQPKSLAHVQVLAAAALHPTWVYHLDGRKLPYCYIPGLKFNFSPGPQLPLHTATLRYDESYSRIEISQRNRSGLFRGNQVAPEVIRIVDNVDKFENSST